jgi:predicted nucleic-acid-binding protein
METPMNDHEHHDVDEWLEQLDVEAIWIADWAAMGIEAIERYLATQAAFAAYLHSRDLDSDDGDGRASA